MPSGSSIPSRVPRSALVMFAASLGFFFVTAATFTSLGYVLYTMGAELGWSKAAAGLSFSLLALACGLSSPLPPILMKMIGTRLTVFAGCLMLATGFFLASQTYHLELFFVATTLMGVGFSLVAPSPAVYLLATWFPRTSARMIGFYFMTGAAGGIAGPLIVDTIVGLTGNWRLHWIVMAASALALGVISLLCIRDAVKVESIDQVKGAGHEQGGAAVMSAWTVRQALMTPSFIILALAMTVVQTVVSTAHSTLVAHIANLGHSAAPGAIAMSLLALAGTGTKGLTGTLCERVDPRRIFIAGLAVQTLAMALLWSAGHVLVATIAATLFGVGWGMAWLSAHILLLRYFGPGIAGDMTAMATTVTTFAIFGPIGAGRIADMTGSYTPALLVLALLLVAATTMSALFLRAPAPPSVRTEEPELAELVPAE